jgi:hypothetical protein
MPAKKSSRRLVHPRGIKSGADPPGPPMIECQIRSPVHNPVEIAARDSVEARVKAIVDLFGRQDRNRMWTKVSIHRIAYFVCRQRAYQI